MVEHRPETTETETDGGAADAVQVNQAQPRSEPERFFNNEAHDVAAHYGWRPFHLRDRDSIHIVRGRGFPDLVMWRKNYETGQIDLLAAELKRDAKPADKPRQFGPGQEEWIEALRQHIPTYVWRPKDWDEIEHILRNGTEGHPSTPLAPDVPRSVSPIPYNFGDVITNTVEAIEAKEMSTGDKATLRRMDPANPDSAIFWKIISQRGIPRNADVQKWGLILHGMALMSHTAGLAHNPRIRIGRALYEGDGSRTPFYSEQRLSALLAARGYALHRILARLFRMLASQRCAFNWRDMAWFILNEGYNEERADEARIEIARAYYRAEYSSQTQTE